MVDYFDVISNEFYTFLSTKDVVSLDQACLNKKKRDIFHQALSKANVLDMAYTAASASWIEQRMTLPTSVEFGPFLTKAHLDVLSCLTLWARTIVLKRHNLDKDLVLNFMKSCPSLVVIQCNDGSFPSEEYFTFAIEQGNLTDFTINDSNFPIDSFFSVLKTCKQLRTININQCENLLSNRAVGMIAEHCPQVEMLQMTHLHLVQPEEYQQVAQKCTRLRGIDWQTEHDRYACKGVDLFLKNSPSTLQIVKLSHIEFDGRDFVAMVQRCAKLTSLRMHSCWFIANASMHFAEMVQHCSKLQELQVTHCRWFSDACYSALVHCPQLRTFRSSHGSSVTREIVVGVLSRLHDLETYEVSDASIFSSSAGEVCAALAKHCPRLKSLQMNKSTFSQNELDLLTRECINLVTLELHCFAGTFTLNCTNLKKLRRLSIYCVDGFTKESILQILQSCPRMTHFSMKSINVWRSVDIVRTLVDYCPCVTNLDIGFCTDQVHQAFEELQYLREAEGRVFDFKCIISGQVQQCTQTSSGKCTIS